MSVTLFDLPQTTESRADDLMHIIRTLDAGEAPGGIPGSYDVALDTGNSPLVGLAYLRVSSSTPIDLVDYEDGDLIIECDATVTLTFSNGLKQGKRLTIYSKAGVTTTVGLFENMVIATNHIMDNIFYGSPTSRNTAYYMVTGGRFLDMDFPGDISIPEGQITSGIYTPTYTLVAGFTDATTYECQWMRVGNVVTVSGSISLQVLAGGGAASIRITLPIAASFANFLPLAGTCMGHVNPSYYSIIAESVNNEALFQTTSAATGNNVYAFTFTYAIA